ncbi:hypothetical protein AAE026_11495 [Bradyrhizobium sp. DN5]|uniref:hypothetical protein n=1 Tax=Bradyrhizobium sp. DN5 TaxID=3056950 RepID=UPI0035255271
MRTLKVIPKSALSRARRAKQGYKHRANDISRLYLRKQPEISASLSMMRCTNPNSESQRICRDTRVLMKLVVDGATDRVLGCHIVGDAAAEITQAVAIAVKMKATKADFDATIALHPTAAEELVTMRSPTALHVRQAAE